MRLGKWQWQLRMGMRRWLQLVKRTRIRRVYAIAWTWRKRSICKREKCKRRNWRNLSLRGRISRRILCMLLQRICSNSSKKTSMSMNSRMMSRFRRSDTRNACKNTIIISMKRVGGNSHFLLQWIERSCPRLLNLEAQREVIIIIIIITLMILMKIPLITLQRIQIKMHRVLRHNQYENIGLIQVGMDVWCMAPPSNNDTNTTVSISPSYVPPYIIKVEECEIKIIINQGEIC